MSPHRSRFNGHSVRFEIALPAVGVWEWLFSGANVVGNALFRELRGTPASFSIVELREGRFLPCWDYGRRASAANGRSIQVYCCFTAH